MTCHGRFLQLFLALASLIDNKDAFTDRLCGLTLCRRRISSLSRLGLMSVSSVIARSELLMRSCETGEMSLCIFEWHCLAKRPGRSRTLQIYLYAGSYWRNWNTCDRFLVHPRQLSWFGRICRSDDSSGYLRLVLAIRQRLCGLVPTHR